MTSLRNIFSTAALLGAICGLCHAEQALDEAAAPISNVVVAIVNQEVIEHSDVLQRASPEFLKLEEGMAQSEREQRTREILEKALRALIDEKLLLTEAERLSKKNEAFGRLIDDRIALTLEAERRRTGGEAAFHDSLEKAGLTHATYVKRVRHKIMRELVRYHFVTRDLSVSPAELYEHYRKNLSRLSEPDKVRYRQIFIRVDKNKSRAKARELAEYLMDLLEKRHDFASLAREYSDGPHAEEGGLWDFMGRGARPPPIDDLLFSLPIGEVGEPLETDIGFTLVKVAARSPARIIPFEEVQGRLEAELLDRKWLERYRRLIRRLQEQNYVKIFP